jgi:hypothetical protein
MKTSILTALGWERAGAKEHAKMKAHPEKSFRINAP